MSREYLTIDDLSDKDKSELAQHWLATKGMGGVFELPDHITTEAEVLEWLKKTDYRNMGERYDDQAKKSSRFQVLEEDGLVYDKKYDMDWVVLDALHDVPLLCPFGSFTAAERESASKELEGVVNTIRELGTGWRLPTSKEIESIRDDGNGYWNWGPFENVYATTILAANSIGFNFDYVWFCTHHDEIPSLQAFAVRPRCETERLSIEESWKSAMIAEEKRKEEESNNLLKGIALRKEWTPYSDGRFLKDPNTHVIYDTLTSLEWLVGPDKRTNYDEAESWIADIGDGWNMPSRGDLMDLLHSGVSNEDWGPFKVRGSVIWYGRYDSSKAWSFCFDFSKVSKGEYSGRETLTSKEKSRGMRAFAVRHAPLASEG